MAGPLATLTLGIRPGAVEENVLLVYSTVLYYKNLQWKGERDVEVTKQRFPGGLVGTHHQRAMQALQKIASEQGLRVFQVQQVKSQETGASRQGAD